MPQLRWKTTRLETPKGRVKVTHWQKHTPEEILDALNTKPLRRSPEDAKPPFTVHQFGRLELVARRYSPQKTSEEFLLRSPKGVFNVLRRTVAKKLAVLEVPVAFVEHQGGSPVLVTLWKKGSRSLAVVLSDPRLSEERKMELKQKAMVQLARLNYAGVFHDHAFPENFVVLKNGGVRLVDPTLAFRSFFASTEGPLTLAQAFGESLDQRTFRALLSVYNREYARLSLKRSKLRAFIRFTSRKVKGVQHR